MLNRIYLFFKKKWVFKQINKTQFLIIGNDNSDLIIKLLSEKNVEITCFKIINLNIIFQLLLHGKKINKLNYFIKSIELVKPNIILTMLDNDTDFYRLKKYFPNKKFISIQNGYRTESKKTFLIKKGERLSCDLIFCWGKQNVNYYKSMIQSKVVPTGSIKNNLISKKNFKKKEIITYISEYRNYDENKKVNFYNEGEVLWGDTTISDKKLVKLIYRLCKKKKIKFCILGRYNDARKIKEIEFYDKIIGKNNFKYIPKKNYLSSYYFLRKSKTIISMSSSIGYEIFSRGNKIIFFTKKINKLKKVSKYFKFGWPYIKQKKGFFFSDEINNIEMSRLIKNVFNCNQKKWLKKTKRIRDQLIIYDFKNLLLKKEISKLK